MTKSNIFNWPAPALAKLAGMVESDGHFYLGFKPTNARQTIWWGNTAYGYIEFNQKEETMSETLKEFKDTFGGTIKNGRLRITGIHKLVPLVEQIIPFLRGEKGLDAFWFLEALKVITQPFIIGNNGQSAAKFFIEFLECIDNINTRGENRKFPKSYYHFLITNKVGDSTSSIIDSVKAEYETAFKVYKSLYSKRFETPFSPYFLVGLTAGDGSMSIVFGDDSEYAFGIRFIVIFSITLLNTPINRELVENLIIFFGVGTLIQVKGSLTLYYKVQNVGEVYQKIVPFFKQYPLSLTDIRAQQFKVTAKVSEILNKKSQTLDDVMKIIDLTYDLHNPSGRKYSKDELKQIVFDRVNNKG
jgi:hypothetical protein